MTDHDEYFAYLQRRSAIGALYRRHWLYPRLTRRLRGRCLDVGCGIGDMLTFRVGDTVGVDVNPRTVAYCRSRGAAAFTMEPDRLPFAAGVFDSALLDNVLEHIAQPMPLLAEVRRVIKPGGQVLIGVPGRCGWASDPDHKVFYGEGELKACVEPLGFHLREVFHTPLWRSAWLDRNIRQYCVYGLFDRA